MPNKDPYIILFEQFMEEAKRTMNYDEKIGALTMLIYLQDRQLINKEAIKNEPA